ncbi:MAG: hypothetical protein CSB44_01725 [Gammaproteobacteria bacterium]|nr:MAG: hypothetical protein CSB44_01725 [Gammaproteobacteria bacterium]
MKILIWLVALAAATGVVVLVEEASNRPGAEFAKTVPVELPKATIVDVQLTDQPVMLTVLARLGPRYKSEISSIVEGRVSSLGENFFVGAVVRKGEVLARIESSAYVAKQAEAEYALSQAIVTKSEERREAEQAKREWRQYNEQGRAEPSPLFLRAPHVRAAELAVKAAEKNLLHAEGLVAATSIKAPFDATVVTRNLSPGEFVSAGQVIAELVSSHTFEVAAQLTAKQWELLDPERMQDTVNVKEVGGDRFWGARVRSLGRLFDERTQLRSVFLTLQDDSPVPELIGGQLVEVKLPGRIFEDVLVVPESAYTRDSAIWVLDEEDRLEKLPVELLATQDSQVIVERPLSDVRTFRIVRNPQSRFTVGMRVKPIDSDSNLMRTHY